MPFTLYNSFSWQCPLPRPPQNGRFEGGVVMTWKTKTLYPVYAPRHAGHPSRAGTLIPCAYLAWAPNTHRHCWLTVSPLDPLWVNAREDPGKTKSRCGQQPEPLHGCSLSSIKMLGLHDWRRAPRLRRRNPPLAPIKVHGATAAVRKIVVK